MRLLEQINNNKKGLGKDIIAGIIVALVSIPIGMGYSQIAGLPVIYGLYGSMLPILIFALLTTSPQFVVGIDAMPAVMVGGLLAQLGIEAESEEALKLVPVVSILVAVCFVLFYLVRAGRIVKYISTPVMGGFISGVGATIILMQIPKLFGGSAGTGELLELVAHIIDELDNFNTTSACLGFGTITVILVCKKYIPKVPMTVIMMIVGALLQAYFKFDQYGVKLLPSVSGGMPQLVMPDFSMIMQNPEAILMESVSIAGVIMAQTLLATGNYSMKYGDKVDNNKELLAYAGMNIASAAVGCPPINGSVSRSGIADSFGARSQLMSIASGLTMLVVLLFGTPLLKYLPVPILTGIVMTALIGILEIKLMKRLYASSKNEWLIFMISFVGVLVLGTVNGVIIGCVLSFGEVAIKATAPPTAFVGRIPGQGNFFVLGRNSNALPIKNVVIYRFSGNLFFANIDRFQNDIEKAIKEDTKCVVVDARGIGSIDVTATARLVTLYKSLSKRGIRFYITEHEGSLNDEIRILGGEELIEHGIVRRTISLALRDYGITKPYQLEEGYDVIVVDEPDEKLAEFEWAFGKEAEERLKLFADETVEKVSMKMINNDDTAMEQLLEENEIQTNWGKLGRFEENEFWDFLEMRLEQMFDDGKMDEAHLEKWENKIEERRLKSEERLKNINPRALAILEKHRERIIKHLEQNNPKEYEHMKMIQEKFQKEHDIS